MYAPILPYKDTLPSKRWGVERASKLGSRTGRGVIPGKRYSNSFADIVGQISCSWLLPPLLTYLFTRVCQKIANRFPRWTIFDRETSRKLHCAFEFVPWNRAGFPPLLGPNVIYGSSPWNDEDRFTSILIYMDLVLPAILFRSFVPQRRPLPSLPAWPIPAFYFLLSRIRLHDATSPSWLEAARREDSSTSS